MLLYITINYFSIRIIPDFPNSVIADKNIPTGNSKNFLPLKYRFRPIDLLLYFGYLSIIQSTVTQRRLPCYLIKIKETVIPISFSKTGAWKTASAMSSTANPKMWICGVWARQSTNTSRRNRDCGEPRAAPCVFGEGRLNVKILNRQLHPVQGSRPIFYSDICPAWKKNSSSAIPLIISAVSDYPESAWHYTVHWHKLNLL